MSRLDRRTFLQSSLALGLSTVLPLRMVGAASARRASVLEFGADPKGEIDATAAVRRAIASLGPNGARLVFPAGKYRFDASEETAMQFTGFDGIEIYANDAELLFAGNTVPFGFQRCKDVAVHDMKIRWDRPAFSQGIVKEANAKSFVIEIDPAFPVTGREKVTGIAEFVAETRRPTLNGVNRRGLRGTSSLIAPQQLRITTDEPLRVRPGMLLALLHADPAKGRDIASFLLEQCEGVLLEEVKVQHAPGGAFLLKGCRDLHIENVTVAPGAEGSDAGKAAQPLLSTLGDGLHCRDCHGTFVLKENRFEGIAGDGVNIYQSYWKITQRLDDRTVVLAGNKWETPAKWQLPEAGDFIQFTAPDTLALLGEIGVREVGGRSPSAQSSGVALTFSETLSPVIVPGTLVCGVVDAPRIRMDHCTIANTLGRGAILHSRAEIVDSHFQGCSREAVLLAPDLNAMQGPAVQNVRIRTTTFEDCSAGEGDRGVITIDTSQSANPSSTAGMPNSVVRIQGNTFVRTSSASIFASGVDDLVISENILGHAASGPRVPVAISLRNAANVAISSNASSVPQTITLTNCASTVKVESNRMLAVSN